MARKFLYLIAVLTVLVIAGLLALRFYAAELSAIAFVPKEKFAPAPPLAASLYDDPKMWIARPDMAPAANPALWQPAGLKPAAEGSLPVAVFFVHPTSYLSSRHWNAPLDDAEANDRALLFTRGMASAFSRGQVWAPRYRQATFGAFLSQDPAALRAIEVAHGDVLQAFDRFVARVPADVPIVIAGHSQGALLVMRLLQDRVTGKPLARRIAATYVIGWPVSQRHDLPAMGLPACAAPDQPGCLVSWSSWAEPAEPETLLPGIPAATALDGQPRMDAAPLCTNPLTGTIGAAAPAGANHGTLVPSADLKSGEIRVGMVPARCSDQGLLLVGPPPQMGPYVAPGNNYHVYDVPLFWVNLREDFARRVAAWKP